MSRKNSEVLATNSSQVSSESQMISDLKAVLEPQPTDIQTPTTTTTEASPKTTSDEDSDIFI